MKKSLFLLSLAVSFAFIFLTNQGCSNDDDSNPVVNNSDDPDPVIELNNEINDFVWSGLNEIYLWKDDVPNLADDKFNEQEDYYSFLNGYTSPENLFNALLYREGEVDRFSFLVDDYEALEQSFQGSSKSNGLDFGLIRLGSSNNILGFVRYIANGSDAASKDINRGDFFLTVDGQQLTIDNYVDLLFGANNTYTLGMANIEANNVSLNGTEVLLTKSDFTENPILINKVIDAGGIKVGYLMYNQFIANFDNELNDVMTQFKNDNITELVLDLRYNPGGRVTSAIILSSMITGQFTGQVFSTEIWNGKYQSYFEANDPERLVNRFTDKLLDDTPISRLNLNKLYVLTTNSSASASELVINGLNPYIDVIQIGTNTTGKYTGSVTLYDSADFGKENANPNHKYAMQPLVFKSANRDGVGDYFNGLAPNYIISYETTSGSISEGENILDMGTLGDENEPFLDTALAIITGEISKSVQSKSSVGLDFKTVADTKDFTLLGKSMYKNFED